MAGRRPRPYFDARRNAWITRAGGRFTTLAAGPKNADTEAEAWRQFYRHMASLGTPTVGQAVPAMSLGELADEYAAWMEQEVAAGRLAQTTRDYYVRYLQSFLDTVGGRRPVTSLKKIELERFKTGWHSVQTVQRLFNWGVEMELIAANPFRGVRRPPAGARQRILSRDELAQMLRATDRAFGQFLLAMRNTIARPQEIRALQWKHFVAEPLPQFVLTEFKLKRLRKDQNAVRRIPLNARMVRMLARLAKRRQPSPQDYVFLNRSGRPWSNDAVRCRMRRLRDKLGLEPDERGEQIVAYSLRHSAATLATANGTPQKLLAEMMGHVNIATTERYQHPGSDHLHQAIEQATRRYT